VVKSHLTVLRMRSTFCVGSEWSEELRVRDRKSHNFGHGRSVGMGAGRGKVWRGCDWDSEWILDAGRLGLDVCWGKEEIWEENGGFWTDNSGDIS
jgi:hypothetical protein